MIAFGAAIRGAEAYTRYAQPGVPIYDRKLRPDEVLERVERYHAPYHRALDEACDRLHAQFGTVWHVNCHSMPSTGNRQLGRKGEHGDFVLGDRDGTTCAPEFTDFVAGALRKMGYEVHVNDGYKGVEIVRRQGRPNERRHSLQIEIDRALYMDQRTLEKNAGFDATRADLAKLVEELRDFIGAGLVKAEGLALMELSGASHTRSLARRGSRRRPSPG